MPVGSWVSDGWVAGVTAGQESWSTLHLHRRAKNHIGSYLKYKYGSWILWMKHILSMLHMSRYVTAFFHFSSKIQEE